MKPRIGMAHIGTHDASDKSELLWSRADSVDAQVATQPTSFILDQRAMARSSRFSRMLTRTPAAGQRIAKVLQRPVVIQIQITAVAMTLSSGLALLSWMIIASTMKDMTNSTHCTGPRRLMIPSK